MITTLDGVSTSLSNTDFTRRAKLEDASQQFEAMMLQELLKPMRTGEDDLSGEKNSDGSMDTIASFGTEAVAKAIAESGGLGVANQVMRELSRREQSPKAIPTGKESEGY
jgi:Rod binding domain-containing protein